MKQFIRDYFLFNRRERNGIFVLISILLLLILYFVFADVFFTEEKVDFSLFEKDIKNFELQTTFDSLSNDSFKYDNLKPTVSIKKCNERFYFNPNTLSEFEWKRMGLSDKQIRVIKNYENKGGRFRKKEDFKKMYCIPPNLYTALEPYIQIPIDSSKHLSNPAKEKTYFKNYKIENKICELNDADTTELILLKGIGSSFAKRIINYRNKLGGYVKKEQLMEVYGFDKERYNLISQFIIADSLKIHKLNINYSPIEELKSHPYIKFNLANLIVNYRKQHGNYHSIEEVKKLNLMEEEIYNKLAPYLKIE